MDEVDDILEQNLEEDEEDDEEMDVEEGKGQDDDEDDDDDDNENENERDNDNDNDNDEDEDDDDEDDDEDDEDDDEDDDDDDDRSNSNNTNSGGDSEDNDDDDDDGDDDEFKGNRIFEYYRQMRLNSKLAEGYNISPYAAIPIQTDVNALAVSKGLRNLFLGGADGFIRKFDLLGTLAGKMTLTIIQKHSLSESMEYAGILQSYWENEIPQKRSNLSISTNGKEYVPMVSPVNSLEVHSECLYLLSGLQNGGIALQGLRYMEGKIGHYFYPGTPTRNGHTQVVNLLKLNSDQSRFLSGSWDKKILEWDLNGKGTVLNEFKGANSELSSLEMRPLYSTIGIEDFGRELPEETASQPNNNDSKLGSRSNSNSKTNGDSKAGKDEEDDEMDSLFGDDDEDEDEEMKDAVDEIAKATQDNEKEPEQDEKLVKQEAISPEEQQEEARPKSPSALKKQDIEEISQSTLNIQYDECVFMTSGLNGSVQIWDRRINTAPVLNMERNLTTPPWCQSACWGTDGDSVYAGRRNACVEEFSLRMPGKPKDTLKLPSISGPVTCIQAMPNNRHILCASRDNIRLFDIRQSEQSKSKSPFLIVPGHHGGAISNIYVDPTCRFMISTSGNRGWQGTSTDTTFIYEIDLE
ncbi:SAGA complex subunit SPT8 [Nakaseomyces bracarensis]|uniref:SAGA complex subunit SPT8 n=1 Tax=Nakaseomyces bracarensis TaxID=273131 RepID=UPI003871B1FB